MPNSPSLSSTKSVSPHLLPSPFFPSDILRPSFFQVFLEL
jgi:hypothetical protein